MNELRSVAIVALAFAATWAASVDEVAWTVLFCTLLVVTLLLDPRV